MITPVPSRKLEGLLTDPDQKSVKHMMKHIYAIQLTNWCSINCIGCGTNANNGKRILEGERYYIPGDLLIEIFETYSKELASHDMHFYFSSDPFDYDFDGYDYMDIHNKFAECTGIVPYLSTSVPIGKEEKVIRLLLTTNITKPERNIIEIQKLLTDTPIQNSSDYDKLYALLRAVDAEGDIDEKVANTIKQMFGSNKTPSVKILQEFFNEYISAKYYVHWESSPIHRVSINVCNYKRLKKSFEEYFPNLEKQIEIPFALRKNAKLFRLDTDNIENLQKIVSTIGVDDESRVCFLPFTRYSKEKQYNETIFFVELPDNRVIASPKRVDFIDVIACLTGGHIKNKYDRFCHTEDGKTEANWRKLGPSNLDKLYTRSITATSGFVILPDTVQYIKTTTPSKEYPFGFEVRDFQM